VSCQPPIKIDNRLHAFDSLGKAGQTRGRAVGSVIVSASPKHRRWATTLEELRVAGALAQIYNADNVHKLDQSSPSSTLAMNSRFLS